MNALINANSAGRKQSAKALVAKISQELKDHREESFARMVCDGMPLGEAYRRAGFNGKSYEAAHALAGLPRIKLRIEEILFARSTTAAVSLEQVTDMLGRVFMKAVANEELNAAHNAAFSLARLYGHVTEKSQVEVLRKPSREPDAPAELSLTAWVSGLMPTASASIGPLQRAPAGPMIEGLANQGPPSSPAISEGPGPASQQLDLFNDVNSLAAPRDGREIENGASFAPVTGPPSPGGRSDVLGPIGKTERVPVPSWDELFG